jgi:predicted RNase H-related nuclease YkuK (DUF458 family)
MQWKTLSGGETTLKEFLSQYNEKDWHLYIGTDSQTKGRKTKFDTVLVAWKEGYGAFGIHRSSIEYNIRDLRDQLIQETWLSIELAQVIKDMVDKDIIIHMDVNSNERFKSGKYKNELIGFVKGLGFDYAIKPFSWVASAVADRGVR